MLGENVLRKFDDAMKGKSSSSEGETKKKKGFMNKLKETLEETFDGEE